MGANVFPHNASYNPTGPVGALRLLDRGRDQEPLHQEPGTVGGRHDAERCASCCSGAARWHRRCALRMAMRRRGEKKFEDCVACHSTDRNAQSVGPSLFGVFDRKAGAAEDFRYSPAMKRERDRVDAADSGYVRSPIRRRRCPPTACPMRA